MSLTNATPRIVFGGINDKSRGTPSRGAITYPQHAPLLRLWCESGPEETLFIGNESGSFNGLYGSQTLNRRSKFYNLQSLLAEKLLGEGNGFFVKRLIPEDARKARILVGFEYVEDLIPAMQTRLSGFNYDGTIQPGAEATLPPVEGYRARIVLMPATTEPGHAKPIPGTLLAEATGNQSTIYPLFELSAAHFGKSGDNLGLRIWSPTYASNEVFDEAAATQFGTRMYRMQFMQKVGNTNTPAIVVTAMGEDYVDVCFQEGAYGASNDKEYYIKDVLKQAYSDDGLESGLAPLHAPFNQLHVYADNLAVMQELIYEAEIAANPATAQYLTAPGQVDIFTGLGIDGDPYQSLYLLGPLDGGIALGQGTTVYAVGGADGTINHQKYEELVTLENVAFGQLGDMYEDIAMYPFSHIYDTGLSMDGKVDMMNVLAARKDLKCVFTTYVEAEGRAPTLSEELSRGQVLETRLQAYPESTLYGTGVCRAEIIYQTGELMGGKYSRPVPQLIDYAVKWAKFAGAGTGVLRDGADIDQEPNNIVTEVKNLNVPYFNARAQANAWSSGGTYSLTYDVRANYYPCIRSVYSDETSVLLSPITVNIACDIARMITRIHAKFSGNAKLTKQQLAERCDKAIIAETNGRYAGRVTIEPETHFTEEDDNNGFSWHCRVRLYANNPRTTMFFELETHRTEALGE